MSYWWVNQGGTFEQSLNGSYLWSPETTIDGKRNHGYDNMKRLLPGDQIFSHHHGEIKAIGTINSRYYSATRPKEFPADQNPANANGYRVDASIKQVMGFNPATHIKLLRNHLPHHHAPLDKNGVAVMTYLLKISDGLANEIKKLLKVTDQDFPAPVDPLAAVADAEIQALENEQNIPKTQREAAILVRVGQRDFRANVYKQEKKCRITGMANGEFLIASHIKPWRECTDTERLDTDNGLMLSPTIDKLFDKNYISFEDNGDLIISNRLTTDEQKIFNISSINVGKFTAGQKRYLALHRAKLKK